jgi:hypothetical protein
LVAGSVLESDVVVNLPKLKTHAKAGITCCLKNLVGINGDKDWLPHHRIGSATRGGDEYLSPSIIKSWLTRALDSANAGGPTSATIYRKAAEVLGRLQWHTGSDQLFEGSWYGNDTIWRTVLDLNRILIYADKNGVLMSTPQRRVLHVVDAVIAGEGQGPMNPTPRPIGVILAGYSAPPVDAVAATLMGFDSSKIPAISRSYASSAGLVSSEDPGDMRVLSRGRAGRSLDELRGLVEVAFQPSTGWLGHIEAVEQPQSD